MKVTNWNIHEWLGWEHMYCSHVPSKHTVYYYPGQKKEPSLWCIMWYRRICSLISPRCIDAWSRGSRKSRSLAVSQLNQARWFLDITRFWFYASTGWFFFFLSRVVLPWPKQSRTMRMLPTRSVLRTCLNHAQLFWFFFFGQGSCRLADVQKGMARVGGCHGLQDGGYVECPDRMCI